MGRKCWRTVPRCPALTPRRCCSVCLNHRALACASPKCLGSVFHLPPQTHTHCSSGQSAVFCPALFYSEASRPMKRIRKEKSPTHRIWFCTSEVPGDYRIKQAVDGKTQASPHSVWLPKELLLFTWDANGAPGGGQRKLGASERHDLYAEVEKNLITSLSFFCRTLREGRSWPNTSRCFVMEVGKKKYSHSVPAQLLECNASWTPEGCCWQESLALEQAPLSALPFKNISRLACKSLILCIKEITPAASNPAAVRSVVLPC